MRWNCFVKCNRTVPQLCLCGFSALESLQKLSSFYQSTQQSVKWIACKSRNCSVFFSSFYQFSVQAASHLYTLCNSPLFTSLFTHILSHLCLWFLVLWLLEPCHSSTFHHHALWDIHPPFSLLLFSSLLPFSLLMSKTLKTFPGMINVLLGLTLTLYRSLFFWRVNTKRKWRKSSYHCLPLDSISISVSLLFPLLRPLISTHPSSPLLFHPVSLFHSFILLYWKPAATCLFHKSLAISNEKKKKRNLWRKPHFCLSVTKLCSVSTTVLNTKTSIFHQIFKQLKHI